MTAYFEQTTAHILRMSDEKTMQLIDLYKAEECLWNTQNESYRDQTQRRLAAEKVARLVDIPNFGPRHVLMKFKNIRNAYSQELKKIARNEMSGKEYKPTVFWFEKMDSFIRPHLQKPRGRRRHPSLVYHVEGTEEWLHANLDEVTASEIIPIELVSENDSCDSQRGKRKLQTSPSSRSLKMSKTDALDIESGEESFVEISVPSKTETRKKDNSEIEQVKKHIDKQQKTIVDAIKDLSTNMQIFASGNNDYFDCFGKYVAGLLRTLPHKSALEVQPQIIGLITEAGLKGLANKEKSRQDDDLVVVVKKEKS